MQIKVNLAIKDLLTLHKPVWCASGYWKAYRQDFVGFSGIGGGSSYALAGPPGWVGGGGGGPVTAADYGLTSRGANESREKDFVGTTGPPHSGGCWIEQI